MVLVAKGDRAAFARLATQFAPRIEAYTTRILGGSMAAQDTTQEVMVRLWLRAADYDPSRARLTTWLHQIAHNLCVDYLRSRGSITTGEVTGVESRTLECPSPSVDTPQGRHSGDDLAAAVASGLAGLPERQRSALVLTYYQDLSNREVAEIMAINLRALESLLVRARKALRQDLEQQGWRDGDAA